MLVNYYSWKHYLNRKSFRNNLLMGLVLLIIILIAFPFYFKAVEGRNGRVFNDSILNALVAKDVSYLIFAIIWSSAILMVIRAIQSPKIFILFLWSYIMMSILRMATLSLLPLNPPEDLIPLIDPISNIFYGGKFITKDLFFSGHTATIFLICLCLKSWKEKIIVGLLTILLGYLLLLQHVHYSLDVFTAPIFSWICFLGAQWFVTQKY